FDVLVITNITEDHLDFFKDLADIQDSFIQLLDNAKEGAVIICDTTLPALERVIDEARKKNLMVIDYHTYRNDITVSIPGEHNIHNAEAALAVVDYLGLDVDMAHHYLANDFKG